jgi:GTPase-associated protein 1, N-terminal domain type 1
MKGVVDQALYGYREGHRLIASSTPITAHPNRVLRSLTDMAFDGDASSYLTCFPLPDLGRYALVKSWPAIEVSRPGAVWSHVLLVDFVDLGAFEHLAGLATLFARPQTGDEGHLQISSYGEAKAIPARSGKSLGVGERIDAEVRRQVLWAVYGESEVDGVVQVPESEQAEELLFAVWAQQWPRLRRSFAFRTRYRATETSGTFDLQLVERLHRNQRGAVELEGAHWLEMLVRDLAEPDPALREFLRRFGAESDRGKADLPSLARLWLDLEQRADFRDVSSEVCKDFRKRQSMQQLKSALFGPADQERAIGPKEEPERLKGILAARPATALDLDDLEFRLRVDRLWQSERHQAVDLLRDISTWKPPNKQAVTMLLESAVANVAATDVPVLASSDEGLAIALVTKRPELLKSPAVWRTEAAFVGELLELAHTLDAANRLEILLVLLRNNSAAANDVLAQEPELWWDAIGWGAHAIEEGRSWSRTVSALQRALESVGPGGVGSAPGDLSEGGRVLLAVVASPLLGLWRQVRADQWAAVASAVVKIEDPHIRHRAMLVLLAATGLPTNGAARTRLWLAAFGPLHEALGRDEVDEDDLSILNDVLPKPNEDWQERLRKGLMKEMKKDRWDPQDIRHALDSVPAHREEMLKGLESKKKSRKSWAREIVDFFSP